MILEVGYCILLSSKMEWKKLTFDEIRCTSIGDTANHAVYTKTLSALSSAFEIIFPSITPAYCSGGAYMIRCDDLTQQSVTTVGDEYPITTLREWNTSNNTLGICCLKNPWGLQGMPCSLSYVYYKTI